MTRVAAKTKAKAPVKKSKARNGKNVQLTSEQKLALAMEYATIVAERERGVRLAKNWNSELRARHGGVTWNTLKRLVTAEVPIVSQRKGTSGRPCLIDEKLGQEIMAHMAKVGYNQTYKQLEDKFDIDDNTIRRWMIKQKWRFPKNRNFKPLLSQKNIDGRVEFATNFVGENFDDWVDIDEKIFRSQATRCNIKLPPGVRNPVIKTHNKRHFPKVMVLTAIAKPRPEHAFDGKIGIWRCAVDYTAKNPSKNHAKGDIYQKDANMNRAMYVRMVRTLVIPAIRRKMHWASHVRLQTDSAGGHGMSHATGKAKVVEALRDTLKVDTHKCTVELVIQPGQSPDTNCNDLGFYNSMDASLPPTRPYKLDALFNTLVQFWEAYDSNKLTLIFKKKGRILADILKVKGDNDY
jgi:hypothetical protein